MKREAQIFPWRYIYIVINVLCFSVSRLDQTPEEGAWLGFHCPIFGDNGVGPTVLCFYLCDLSSITQPPQSSIVFVWLSLSLSPCAFRSSLDHVWSWSPFLCPTLLTLNPPK